jgi:hypothetical protein
MLITMSTMTETSLADMKAGFPSAPKPIQGILNLQYLIELLFLLCRCAQTHRSPASTTMNLLFCACPKKVYRLFPANAYLTNFAPFPPVVDEVPDYTQCTDDNDRAAVHSKHALNKKMRANIVTMNATLTNGFHDALLLQLHTAFQQQHLREPNIIFANMFSWFLDHYGKTTAKDCKANQQRMAANWHPTNSFDALVLCLFTVTAFAGCTNYMMADHDIIDIRLRFIKQCRLYPKEYKAWIARKAVTPRIVEKFDTFKLFWAAKITLINQMAIPASMHCYGMAAVNNNDSVILYSESIANFGATYAATQESMKTQGSTIVLMQAQLQAMQQYCMVLQQQPPPATYALQQQQRGHRRSLHHTFQCGGGGHTAPAYPQPATAGQCPMQPPMPFKRYKNWNYCHTHGGNVDSNHTSGLCQKLGPLHNPSAMHLNMM